jgi:hypothetical protein
MPYDPSGSNRNKPTNQPTFIPEVSASGRKHRVEMCIFVSGGHFEEFLKHVFY